MLTKSTQLGNVFFAVGLLAGGISAAKKGKPTLTIGLFALGYGVGGYILGNAITNFYNY